MTNILDSMAQSTSSKELKILKKKKEVYNVMLSLSDGV
jgi:hypothetical protein